MFLLSTISEKTYKALNKSNIPFHKQRKEEETLDIVFLYLYDEYVRPFAELRHLLASHNIVLSQLYLKVLIT